MRGAAMSSTVLTRGVIILLTAAERSFKQREFTPSTKMCSFSGSTVKIRCHPGFCSATVEYDTHWAKGSDFKDRVKFACDKNDCTLSISDLRDNDPDEFFFTFTQMQREERSSIGLTLSVKDLRLDINVRQTNNHLELVCTSNCQLPDNVVFQWYKNGQTLHEKTQNMILRETSLLDSYQCALQGHSHRSLQVYAPRNMLVTPYGEIKEDSLVNLTCRCDAHPAATFAWYKMDRGQKPFPQKMEPYLIFRSIKSTDSGHYQCTAENDLGKNSEEIFIDVKYAPRSVSVSVSPSGDILEGQSVTLNCSSDANPSARNTWYKNDKVVSVEPHGIYSIISVKSGNTGDYYCKSENDYGHSIESIYIKVLYAPKRPSLSISPSGELLENNEVTLTCSSDANPPANYTWYKKGKRLPEGSGHNFIITKTRLDQSGYYYCEAQNRWGRHNTTIHLTIVPESQKTVIIGIISVISLAIILLSVFLLLRKRRSASSLPEPTGRPKSSEQGQPGTVKRQDHTHEDVCYASVHFLRKQTDPIYCNIRPVGAHKLNEEEDESVEYSVVKFSNTQSVSRTEDQPAEDPASLYSAIRKFR
ncbi:B-cell receptor CD22-like isoform 2-T2 [Menidia menidia]